MESIGDDSALVADGINQLDDTLLTEILTFLTLSEVGDTIRLVSKSLHPACQKYKSIHLEYLNKKFNKVQVFGLKSDVGRNLNGRIGFINGKFNEATGRYPVKFTHRITGEETNHAIKPRCLNIYPPPRLVSEEEENQKLLKYSSDSKVKLNHGILLDECLMTARFSSNINNGYSYFPNDYERFRALPRNHPAVGQASSTMFTFWTIRPNQAGRHGNISVLDMTVRSLLDNEDNIIQSLGKQVNWPSADGLGGERIVRNYVRFMKAWDTERVSGQFWVTNVFKTGTIMVETDVNGDLGKVYLVRGMNSVIGELFQGLPALCNATLLPLYNFLVYDGILMGMPPLPYHLQSIDRLDDHVKEALNNGSVITQGQSSLKGLWETPAPPLPRVIDDNKPLDWNVEDGNEDNGGGRKEKEEINFTDSQKKLGMKLAKLIQKKGGIKGTKKQHSNNMLLFRRCGYTSEENPGKACMIMYNCRPFNMFSFNGSELSYDLNEILQQLTKVVKQLGNLPCLIMADELSVVEPLRKLLNVCFDKVDGEISNRASLEIDWYPPPTEEETRFATLTGGGSPF